MTAKLAITKAQPALPADLEAELAAYRLLNRTRRAGFTFQLGDNDDLLIAPPGQLDDIQRQALKAAKPQIIHLLRIEARPAPRPATQTWSQLPPAPPPICCADCRHSSTAPQTDPVYGWRRCAIGLGGGLARQDRHCEGFEAQQPQEAAP
jgi:hypothetical protein